jgi:hypothetical protein
MPNIPDVPDVPDVPKLEDTVTPTENYTPPTVNPGILEGHYLGHSEHLPAPEGASTPKDAPINFPKGVLTGHYQGVSEPMAGPGGKLIGPPGGLPPIPQALPSPPQKPKLTLASLIDALKNRLK